MKEIYKDAPNISIGSYAYLRSDQVHALSTNNLDFVVDPVIPRSDEINSEKVFEDDFVVMHRDGHDLSKIKNVTVDDILNQKHLHVSGRKRGLHLIDVELDKIGYRRKVALRCQHFLIAPSIIQSTDLVLMGTRSFAKRNDMPFVEIPIDIPSMEYFISGIKIMSAPPAIPAFSAICPASRPITSSIIDLLWLAAVDCRLSKA